MKKGREFTDLHCYLWIDRQILSIQSWCLIVKKYHIVSNGIHLSLTLTMNTIRTQWNTDISVRGIYTFFNCNCMNSYEICREVKNWDEIIMIFQNNLNVILDTFCSKYIVLRIWYKRQEKRNQIITLYHCHRGGNKDYIHKKSNDVRFSKKWF